MKKVLTNAQIAALKRWLEIDEETNGIWEFTDDKSFDPIRNESDDKAFPYVILLDGNFYDAISSHFYNMIMEVNE